MKVGKLFSSELAVEGADWEKRRRETGRQNGDGSGGRSGSKKMENEVGAGRTRSSPGFNDALSGLEGGLDHGPCFFQCSQEGLLAAVSHAQPKQPASVGGAGGESERRGDAEMGRPGVGPLGLRSGEVAVLPISLSICAYAVPDVSRGICERARRAFRE